MSDHGRFCWYDLMSTDPDASLAFYGRLFGWTRRPMDTGGDPAYDMICAGEKPIGGIVPLDPDGGIPSHWMPYVQVDRLEDACAAAVADGGALCVEPTDVGPGRFAVITDPQGGALSLWESGEPQNSAPPTRDAPNEFCWCECMSTDAAAGAAYYAKLFGWSVEEFPLSAGHTDAVYRLFSVGEGEAKRDHAGIMDLPPPAVAEGAPTHWLGYVNVEDVDAAAAQAADLGAALLCPCTDIPDVGRFCVIQDPQGGTLAMFMNVTKEDES